MSPASSLKLSSYSKQLQNESVHKSLGMILTLLIYEDLYHFSGGSILDFVCPISAGFGHLEQEVAAGKDLPVARVVVGTRFLKQDHNIN